jgi:hypothetical protein
MVAQMAKVLKRKDGQERVRTTVYVPPKVSRTLHMRAAETGAEMSVLVTTALEAMYMPPKVAAQSALRAPAVTPHAPALGRPARDPGATTQPPDANPSQAVTEGDPWPSLEDAACWTSRQLVEYAAHRQKLLVASCGDKREHARMDALVDRRVDDVVAKRQAQTPPRDQREKRPK